MLKNSYIPTFKNNQKNNDVTTVTYIFSNPCTFTNFPNVEINPKTSLKVCNHISKITPTEQNPISLHSVTSTQMKTSKFRMIAPSIVRVFGNVSTLATFEMICEPILKQF